jgi:hypothetical protein
MTASWVICASPHGFHASQALGLSVPDPHRVRAGRHCMPQCRPTTVSARRAAKSSPPRVPAPERPCGLMLTSLLGRRRCPMMPFVFVLPIVVRGALNVDTFHCTCYGCATHMLHLAAHVSLLIVQGAGGVAPTSVSCNAFQARCRVVRHLAVNRRTLHAACVAGSSRSGMKHVLDSCRLFCA